MTRMLTTGDGVFPRDIIDADAETSTGARTSILRKHF